MKMIQKEMNLRQKRQLTLKFIRLRQNKLEKKRKNFIKNMKRDQEKLK